MRICCLVLPLGQRVFFSFLWRPRREIFCLIVCALALPTKIYDDGDVLYALLYSLPALTKVGGFEFIHLKSFY